LFVCLATGYLLAGNADTEQALLLPGTGAQPKAVNQNAAMGLSTEQLKSAMEGDVDTSKVLSFEIDANKVEGTLFK
jgi:hypothetical protein